MLQVENFAGCIVCTGQEAPESNKRIREDLYKKMMSADGLHGRKPYGTQTRILKVEGWKRRALNTLPCI